MNINNINGSSQLLNVLPIFLGNDNIITILVLVFYLNCVRAMKLFSYGLKSLNHWCKCKIFDTQSTALHLIVTETRNFLDSKMGQRWVLGGQDIIHLTAKQFSGVSQT